MSEKEYRNYLLLQEAKAEEEIDDIDSNSEEKGIVATKSGNDTTLS